MYLWCLLILTNILCLYWYYDRVQTHFENIQRIADTTTLPCVMHCLSSRIAGELDLSHLIERLMKGKGQQSSEKLELWEKLKILSTEIIYLLLMNLCLGNPSVCARWVWVNCRQFQYLTFCFQVSQDWWWRYGQWQYLACILEFKSIY